MTKPTDEELSIALNEAAQMREHGKDHKYIAKTLLNMNYRLHYYERMFKLAERYLYFGMEESEHQELLKAVQQIRDMELKIVNTDDPPIVGL